MRRARDEQGMSTYAQVFRVGAAHALNYHPKRVEMSQTSKEQGMSTYAQVFRVGAAHALNYHPKCMEMSQTSKVWGVYLLNSLISKPTYLGSG